MISWLFGHALTVHVTILGVVADRVVRWNGPVRLRGPADVRKVLQAAGRAARADLLGALAGGTQPALLLDGQRLNLPEELSRPVPDGANLSWLMPLAGG